MDLRSSLLYLVGSPERAWYTLLIGVLLLVRELTVPSRVVPGIMGGVAVLTAAHALVQYGITMTGFGLLGLGIALCVFQAFHGLWYAPAVASALTTAAGARELIASPERLSWTAAAAGAAVAVISAVLLRIAVRAHRNKMAT